jgi:hypothetical protein
MLTLKYDNMNWLVNVTLCHTYIFSNISKVWNAINISWI